MEQFFYNAVVPIICAFIAALVPVYVAKKRNGKKPSA
jgi:hypothetical protein